MKRVGELYEVVVFTASVAKVCVSHCVNQVFEYHTNVIPSSMVILFLTNSIFMVSYIIVCSAKAAITTRATTSKICRKLAGT